MVVNDGEWWSGYWATNCEYKLYNRMLCHIHCHPRQQRVKSWQWLCGTAESTLMVWKRFWDIMQQKSMQQPTNENSHLCEPMKIGWMGFDQNFMYFQYKYMFNNLRRYGDCFTFRLCKVTCLFQYCRGRVHWGTRILNTKSARQYVGATHSEVAMDEVYLNYQTLTVKRSYKSFFRMYLISGTSYVWVEITIVHYSVGSIDALMTKPYSGFLHIGTLDCVLNTAWLQYQRSNTHISTWKKKDISTSIHVCTYVYIYIDIDR